MKTIISGNTAWAEKPAYTKNNKKPRKCSHGESCICPFVISYFLNHFSLMWFHQLTELTIVFGVHLQHPYVCLLNCCSDYNLKGIAFFCHLFILMKGTHTFFYIF